MSNDPVFDPGATRIIWHWLINDEKRSAELVKRVRAHVETTGYKSYSQIAKIIRNYLDEINPHSDDPGFSVWQSLISWALDQANYLHLALELAGNSPVQEQQP